MKKVDICKSLRFPISLLALALTNLLWLSAPSLAGAPNHDLEIQLKPLGSKTITKLLSDKLAVEITNTGTKPIAIWQDDCSFGWKNVGFKVQGTHCDTLIERNDRPWRANVLSTRTLKPNEKAVRTINLSDGTWRLDTLRTCAHNNETLHVCATLNIEDEQSSRENHVWTGSVASAFLDAKQ